ncbi:MAG: TlpA disulfide reductase family protein [Sediminibacterium sp.]|nr:TlpA disulfide reductase family protein [Sediminibacterium sp.]
MKIIILFIFTPFFLFGQINSIRATREVKSITKNFMSFWEYYNKEVNLNEDFGSLDESMNAIKKKDFLILLSTGNYLPIRINDGKKIFYKLCKIDSLIDKDITTTLKSIGELYYQYNLMEGDTISNFDFIDLNGEIYNSQTTKNKIVVLKCWFINCQKCNEEIPYLNKLFEMYLGRKDIYFISLALDNENDLKTFLKKVKFNYPVVANQKDYIQNFLKVSVYPTHIIIDRNGKIAKVLNNAEGIKPVLDNLFLQ